MDLETFNIKLIKLVEKKPILYDNNHENYTNREAMIETWREIAKELNDSASMCAERWKNIRSGYIRYLRRNALNGGNSVQSYYLSEHLKFLDHYLRPKIFSLNQNDSSDNQASRFVDVFWNFQNDDNSDSSSDDKTNEIAEIVDDEIFAEARFNKKLIQLVKMHPALYDRKHPDYTKRPVIQESWKTVSKEINEPASVCVERWRSIRGSYVRFLRNCLRNGEDSSKRGYYLSSHLKFLEPFIIINDKKPKILNIETINIPDEDDTPSSINLEFNLKLIELVKMNPILYNHKDFDTSNKDEVQKTWKKIAKEMNEKVSTCIERWKVIRGRLCRDLKSITKGQISKYYLSEHLKFILPYLRNSYSPSTLETTRSSSNDNENQDDYEINEDGTDKISKPHSLKLIELIKTRPLLYDYNHPDYSNKLAVQDTWQIISMKMKESPSACIKRWHSIRSSYNRYLRSLLLKGRNSNYYLAKYLGFVKPFLKPKMYSLDTENESPVENDETIQQSDDENENHNEDSYESESQSNTNDYNRTHEEYNQEHEIKEPYFDCQIIENYEDEFSNDANNDVDNDANNDVEMLQVEIFETNDNAKNIKQEIDPFADENLVEADDDDDHDNEQTEQSEQSERYLFKLDDMEFFKKITPDVALLTESEKRIFRLSVLKILDDLMSDTK